MRFLLYIALILAVAVYGDLCLAIFTMFGIAGFEIGGEERYEEPSGNSWFDDYRSNNQQW